MYALTQTCAHATEAITMFLGVCVCIKSLAAQTHLFFFSHRPKYTPIGLFSQQSSPFEINQDGFLNCWNDAGVIK